MICCAPPLAWASDERKGRGGKSEVLISRITAAAKVIALRPCLLATRPAERASFAAPERHGIKGPLMLAREELVRFEEVAFLAWPAAVVVEYRGMRLRSTGGESRRANSAACYDCDPNMDERELVEVAETFFRARGLPPVFQVGPTAPLGLDALLVARGYGYAARTRAQTTSLGTLRENAGRREARGRTTIQGAPDDVWVDIEVTRGRYANIGAVFLQGLQGLGQRAAFATVHIEGSPAGACLLVHEKDVMVIGAMRTLPEVRRRGAASALLAAAADWGAHRSVALVYLQVEADNDAALALYAKAGFRTQYEYHYRVDIRT